MELGCSTLLYGGYDLDTTLKGIAKAGYKAIELCAIPGMGDHLPHDQSVGYYEDLKKKIAGYGLAIESIGASTNLLDAQARARFIKLMEAGAILGAPAMTTGSGGASDDEESFKVVVTNMDEMAKEAARTGVKISIKPHVRSAVYSTPTSLKFMKAMDTKWIGLNYDASHIWRTPDKEDPVESLKQLASYICTGRIRDTLSRDIPIGPVETQIPGKGAMDIPAICKVFKGIKGLKYLTLEIVGSKDFSLDEVQRVVEESKAYLDKCL